MDKPDREPQLPQLPPKVWQLVAGRVTLRVYTDFEEALADFKRELAACRLIEVSPNGLKVIRDKQGKGAQASRPPPTPKTRQRLPKQPVLKRRRG